MIPTDPNEILLPLEKMLGPVLPQVLVIAALTGIMVQFLKKIPQLANYKEIIPFAALLIGVGMAYLIDLPEPILPGIIAGLLSSGVYQLIKDRIKIPD